ncbi:MAG: SUMF1/EgtB/PvdO family nonheme iron enzyme [Verrucomicrobia bacterium]|nr:SUMF1/EgtB/PvdO family nonheme iron enzyme [Verrucomicrobiota bacterium]
METIQGKLSLTLALLVLGIWTPAVAQDARFFRIVGPVVTTITAVTADGTVTWTNEVTNATFTVQTTTALPDATNWVDWVRVPASNAVTSHRILDPNPPAGMVLIPAGSFTMGDTFKEGGSAELPLHTVHVSAFYMDKYEVTKTLWDEVYQWAIMQGYTFDYGAQGKATNHPVQTANWYDAVKWCNARSEKEGRPAAYYTSAAQTTVYRTGQVNVQNDWVKWNAGYRLPTEAEWEKAARGGASGRRFPWSDSDTIQHSRASYYSSTSYAYDTSSTQEHHPSFNTGGTPYTSPVGSFAANGYGLHDMAGNVLEWCWDWYQSNWYGQTGASQNDTRGPSEALSARVLRGGYWGVNAFNSRCAYRFNNHPDVAFNFFGFRCVREF